jgi:hypothetical protein
LAHYSIIHAPPDWVPGTFAEFCIALTPGGYLLMSFQTGDDSLSGWKELDHPSVSPS